MSDENTQIEKVQKPKGPAWGYHPKEGAKLFKDGVIPEGWADSPADFGDDPAMTLLEEAEELGIRVDGRWSEERLQEEIDAVRAEQDGDSA